MGACMLIPQEFHWRCCVRSCFSPLVSWATDSRSAPSLHLLCLYYSSQGWAARDLQTVSAALSLKAAVRYGQCQLFQRAQQFCGIQTMLLRPLLVKRHVHMRRWPGRATEDRWSIGARVVN